MVWIQEESSHMLFFFLITHGETVIPFVILNSTTDIITEDI